MAKSLQEAWRMLRCSLAATVLAGSGVTFVLVMGWVSFSAILISAGIGVLLALPVSYLVTRAMA